MERTELKSLVPPDQTDQPTRMMYLGDDTPLKVLDLVPPADGRTHCLLDFRQQGQTADRFVQPPELPSYELLGLLAQGGEADVFLARDERNDQFVAIKHIAYPLLADRAAQTRLSFEQQILLRCSRVRNVPHVHEVTNNGAPYLSLDYLDGETVAEALARGPLPYYIAVAIAVGVLDVLEYSHQEGIVHGDIKPANILLVDDEPVLSDWGGAREPYTPPEDDRFFGTPRYASPEQARGVALRPESDLYSLAMTLYEMLTGTVPFDTNFGAVGMLSDRVNNDYPGPPPELRLPEGLVETISWTLRRNPDRRPRNAATMREALVPYASKPRGILGYLAWALCN